MNLEGSSQGGRGQKLIQNKRKRILRNFQMDIALIEEMLQSIKQIKVELDRYQT